MPVTSTPEPVVLGVDVGTTSTKAVAHTVDGAAVATGEGAGYRLAEPEPGAAVLDPEAIWDAVGDAVRAAVAGLPPGSEVAAVSFSAAMHGLLPLDAAGEPLGPLLTWADSRAAGTARALRADDGARALHRRTGVPVHPMSPLVKLAWLRRERPSLHAAAARWGGVKEFVLARATGARVTDRSCASGTGLLGLDGAWDGGALDVAGVDAAALGELVEPTTTVGTLRDGDWDLPDGTPVVAGAGDGPLACLGLGAVRPGVAACSIGTSGALRVVVDRPGVDDAGRVFCYALTADRWVVGGAVTNGGLVLDWARRLLRPDGDVADLLAAAAAVPPGADGLLALPHLLPERAPHWDARGGGVLLGLHRRHGDGHVVRALLEGVCRQVRLVLDALRAAGHDVDEVRATGGFARSGLWRGLLADTLGLPVAFPAGHQGSAFGAALLGMQAVGLLDPGPQALLAAAERAATAGAADGEVRTPSGDDAGLARRLELHERAHATLGDLLDELGP